MVLVAQVEFAAVPTLDQVTVPSIVWPPYCCAHTGVPTVVAPRDVQVTPESTVVADVVKFQVVG